MEEFVTMAVLWVIIIGLVMALLWTYWWFKNATRSKKAKKITFWEWLKPDKKTALLICGWTILVAFPAVFSVLWLPFLAIVLGIVTIVISVFVGNKLFEGWKIKINK